MEASLGRASSRVKQKNQESAVLDTIFIYLKFRYFVYHGSFDIKFDF